jgi:hypothetical protein
MDGKLNALWTTAIIIAVFFWRRQGALSAPVFQDTLAKEEL